METVSIFGWIAASFVLLSFYLSTMVPLRLAAIASNVMFIIYAVLANAPPILVLHCMLFPLNAWRLMEIYKLRRKFMGTSAAQMSTVRLLPFMQKSNCERGRILFNSGDIADNVYVILHGQILLQDSKKLITDGQLLGLIGVISNDRLRTDSALCLTDVELGVIPAEKFWELACQDPMFGNYVIRSMVCGHLTPSPSQPVKPIHTKKFFRMSTVMAHVRCARSPFFSLARLNASAHCPGQTLNTQREALRSSKNKGFKTLRMLGTLV